jgi:hypothetical protein
LKSDFPKNKFQKINSLSEQRDKPNTMEDRNFHRLHKQTTKERLSSGSISGTDAVVTGYMQELIASGGFTTRIKCYKIRERILPMTGIIIVKILF